MDIPYGHLELFVIASIVLVIGFLLFVPMQQDTSRTVSTSPKFTARSRTAVQPPSVKTAPLTFSGHGDYMSSEIPLEEGLYALEYQFPENQVASVRLVDCSSDTEQVMFMKSGSGKLSLSLEDNGPYILQVKSGSPMTDWKIEFRHIV